MRINIDYDTFSPWTVVSSQEVPENIHHLEKDPAGNPITGTINFQGEEFSGLVYRDYVCLKNNEVNSKMEFEKDLIDICAKDVPFIQTDV